MKKMITILSCAAFLAACSGSKALKNEEGNERHLVGGYTEQRNLNEEELQLFSNTYTGEDTLTPVTVATQVVAGTNYRFICKDPKGNQMVVVIYQPLPGQGDPMVTQVSKEK